MSGLATARLRIHDARISTGIIGMHTALVTALAPIDTYDAVVLGSGEAGKLWRTS
jgi:hypothetical protein